VSSDPTAEALRAVSRLQGPYVGLQPYDEDDSAFFFGRSQESAIVAANLRSTKLTLLYGPSGVGKSSLLMAGVVHGLREQARAAAGDSPFAVCVFRSWHHEPLRGLQESCRAALQDLAGEGSLAAPVPGQTLTETLRAWTMQAGVLLIVLDQFEEYFQYYPDDGNAERLTGFAAELAGVVNDLDLAVHVLVSIREDAWASLDRFEGHIHSLFANYLRVDHLDRNAAREAIIEPIGAWNRMFVNGGEPYEIEPVLVYSVIDAAAASAGLAAPSGPETAAQGGAGNRVEAPFLQLVLERIWRAAVADGAHALTVTRLAALGGPGQIVESHLADALGRLTRDEQNVASDCFTFLVSRSRTKVAHPGVDLAEWTKRAESQVVPVLDKLCTGESGRILRPVATSPDDRHASTYELYHDVLAEPVLVWRRTHQQERDRRRLLRVGGVLVALVAVFAAISVWAVVQQRRADRNAQAARQLLEARRAAEWLTVVSHARRLTGTNLAQSLLLGLAANRAVHTPQARSAMVLDLETARQSGVRALLTGHRGAVTGIAFSRDGHTLASSGEDGTVRLWNMNARTEAGAPLRGYSGPVTSVALSPDGNTVASGGDDGMVRVWNVGTHRELGSPMPGYAGSISSVAYSPNGQILAGGDEDGSVRLWDARSRRPFGAPLTGHAGPVTSVVFSPDGRTLASVGDDRTVRLWAVGTSRRLGTGLKCINGGVYSVAFSRDNRLVACGGNNGSVRLWNLRAHRPQGRTMTSSGSPIESLAFSPDRRWLVGVAEGGAVRLWDLRSHRLLRQRLTGSDDQILSARFSPRGNILAGAGFDGTVFVWDLRRHNPVPVVGTGGRAYWVESAVFSPVSPTLAAAGIDGSVRLWDVSRRTDQVPALRVARDPVTSIAFSRDGRILAGSDEDGTVRLWNVDSDEELAASPLRGHVGPVTSVGLSPHGRLLAIAGDEGTVRLRDTSGKGPGETLLRGNGRSVTSVAFSQDGRSLASGGEDGKIRIWDVRGLSRPRAIITGHAGAIYSVAFSQDGQSLASGDENGTVNLWDVRRQPRLRATLTGHTGPVFSIAFSPDGRVLASGGYDGTVRLWDARGGEPLGAPLTHTGSIQSVAFSADGRTIAAVYTDGAIRLWKDVLWQDYAELVARVCGLVSDDLTVRQWGDLAAGLPYSRQCLR
jgi:WD40 repeat protein